MRAFWLLWFALLLVGEAYAKLSHRMTLSQFTARHLSGYFVVPFLIWLLFHFARVFGKR